MSEQRVFNFSAGPAVLPEVVLREAQRDLFALPGVGASILEVSHRGKEFVEILHAAEANLRKLLAIPENYQVLFLQGGSRLQFSMIPMNLLGDGVADYITTGSWGKNAADEAQKEGSINIAWDGKSTNYDRLPAASAVNLSKNAVYAYFTSNETIQGVQWPKEPDAAEVPLVCDASSDFLSRPVELDKYAVLYACAQKNAGPAGVTVVIIRDDLLARCPERLGGMLNYKNHAENESCYNTPPTFAIYVLKLVTDWLLRDIGGLDKMDELNREKAGWMYDAIDNSNGFYNGHAQADCRSLMNVTFRLPNDDLQAKFLKEASAVALANLKGHRSVGGIRASIYNAMPEQGVARLVEFMEKFRQENG